MSSFLAYLRDGRGRWRLNRRLEEENPGVRLGSGVEIRSVERLRLGTEVFVDSGTLLHCGGMDWASPDGGITIGDRTYVGPQSVLFGGGGIEIGCDVLISPGVVLTSHQHTFESFDRAIRTQPIAFARVTVADDVWIGAGAVVLPGVSLGEGCVVGAGAVVSKDVPPGAVVMGVPAQEVRSRGARDGRG